MAPCDAKERIAQLEVEVRGLREALHALYSETADYININHLGPIHWNRSMQLARDCLAASPAPVESEREPRCGLTFIDKPECADHPNCYCGGFQEPSDHDGKGNG